MIRANVVETLEMLYRMARPYWLFVYSLKVIPNTGLAESMKQRGIDLDAIDASYLVVPPRVANLMLYLLVLWRSLETARVARDRVGAFLAAGITAGLAFQVVYNVAMVAGLVPVKGLPLPFMSYGGSSVIYSFLAVGLILNVRMRRFAN